MNKMNIFNLKDGREAKVEVWSFNDLEKYVSQNFPTEKTGENIHFNGFSYLGPSTSKDMKKFNRSNYSDEKKLSPLELQSEILPNQDYHKSVAAIVNDELSGILVCQWIKDSLPFWRYHIKFVDINKNYKNQGIGTNLLIALNNAEFLHNKILQISVYSIEGQKYIKKVVEKELKGIDYAVISNRYPLIRPPEENGKY